MQDQGQALAKAFVGIDIFSPRIDLSSSSPHLRNRIWQEAITTLILTNPECKIPHDQRMYFVIAPNAEYPPFLSNFEGSPGERHVENLKVSMSQQVSLVSLC